MADIIYKIQPGDTLTKIAANNATTIDALAKYNNIADPNKIYAGASLKIPGTVTPPVVVPPAVTALENQNATGVNTTSAGTGSVISTSAPVVANEKNISDAFNNLKTDNVDLTQAHKDYLQMLQDRMDALETRRQNTVNGINAAFDENVRRTKEAQTGETGTYTATLARIGGYLGDSASATGAMQKLNETHVYELNDLEAKRQAAIQEAKNAIDDKQFELAKAKTQEAKDYAKDIQNSKQTFFENAIKLQAATKDAEEQKKQAEVDSYVANLTQKGILDPSEMLKSILASGGSASFAQITNSLKNISDAFNLTVPEYTSAAAMYKDLLLKNQLPADIAAIKDPFTQFTAFAKKYAAALKTSSSSDVPNMTGKYVPFSSDLQAAINSGLSAREAVDAIITLATKDGTEVNATDRDRMLQYAIGLKMQPDNTNKKTDTNEADTTPVVPTPGEFDNSFGTGGWAKIPLSQAYQDTRNDFAKLGFPNPTTAIRDELVKKGYNPKDVYKISENFGEKILDQTSQIFSKLFGG